MTPQDAIWKVLADIQAQSANEPQPDFRVEAELPSATAIMADAAARDPFRLDKIVAFDKPTQPKVDWKMAAMLAADAERRMATMPAPTIGPTVGGRALPSELPNPLAGIPMQVQRDNPLAGLAMPGVQREPISMGWRTPQAMAERATAGAREQFDAQTPIANTAIRMAGPMLGGAVGAVGGPVGMAAGAAMGGTLASQWAQSRETAQGTRAGVNPLVMAAEGYANLLPVMMPEAGAALAPQLPKVLGSALGGAAVSDAAIQMAETGRIDTAALATNTLVGGAIGGGAAVGAHALARGAQSDAVSNLVSDETGAVGPNIREALPQQPEANPGGGAKPPVVTTDPQAINRKVWYHGSRTTNLMRDAIDPSKTRGSWNLAGPGLYVTDSRDISRGYAGTRAYRDGPGSPIVYEAGVSVRRVLDLDAPATDDVRAVVMGVAQANGVPADRAQLLASASTPMEMYRVIGDLPGDTDRMMREVNATLASTYDALTHVGGKNLGYDPHQVLILLDPNGKVSSPSLTKFTGTPKDIPPPQPPDVSDIGGATRFQKLPASERGVLDPLTPERGAQVSPGAQVPVPESMTPSGLTAAERRADKIRIGNAIRRHNVTDDEAALIEQIHEGGRDYNFEQHRGMRTSWAQTDAEASIILPEVKLTKGTTLNAADLTALRRTAHGVASQTVELSDDLALAKGLQTKAAAGDAAAQADLDAILAKHRAKSVPELILAREESYLKTEVAIKSLAGVKSELGRALNALKSFQQKRNMGDAEFLQAVIERGGSGREAIDALSAMRNADGSINREAQFRYLRGLMKPGAQDYWHWYARTAYLSSMATQWRNFSGNAANFGIEALAVRPVAAVIDAKNTNRSVTLSEMRAMGTTSGFLDGLHKASFFFKNGFTKEDVDALESLPPEVFDGKLFPNVIARTMGAVDQFFRTVGFHVELHRMAITEAHKEGLRGDAMLARAKALVDDPTITPDLVARAEKYARGVTFQDKGTAATRAAHGAMKAIDGATKGLADAAWDAGLSKYGKVGSATYGLLSFPPSVIIAPFINTPFNILKRAGQYTPAGLVASKFTKDPRDSAMMAARGAVGTAMMGAAVGLWMNDRITGKPPQYGTPEWETFYATKKPYSIKIGDQWVPYSYLGPVGMVLGATANYADAVSRDPRNVLGYFGKLVGQVGRTAIDASFLRGMQSILMAVADDSPEQRSMQKLANSTVTGLLPLAGLQRDIRNVVDPTLRDPVTSTDMKGFEPQTLRDELSVSLAPIKEQVMGAIPGLSQRLEPRLDRTGKEIQRGSTVWPESRPSDPVREELLRLNGETKGGYYRDPVEAGASLLGKINTEIKRRNREDKGNRPLLASVPRPLITAYAKRYGELSEKRMTWLTGKSWYAEASDDQKRRWVDKVKRDTAEQVDTEFKRRYLQRSTRKR